MTVAQQRQIEALEQRISNLSAAILRINERADLDSILHEIVACACDLTATSRGVITTVDESGEVLEFVSTGFSDEEHRQMAEWVDGPRLFEHMRDLLVPLRLTNLSEWVKELGITTEILPPYAVIGMSLRHRGRHFGNFFVSDKEDGSEFTSADEEILSLFASQAAAEIANVRTHQAEQQARSDLEVLIDTSPIGIAVFDIRSGGAKLFNREIDRIFENLRTPGLPIEHLIEEMTCRFGDGREVALDELPLADALASTKALRVEEIEFSTSDGRSVTALVNLTPIQSKQGNVDTVVVTVQDLAPFEELEQQRSAFLDMVSHELRAPLAAIIGSAVTLDGTVSTIDQAEISAFLRIIIGQAEQMRGLISDLLDAGRIDAGTLSVISEPTEVTTLIDRSRTTFLSGGGRHEITIDLNPELPRVMTDRRRIEQVLTNLLQNAARKAPDTTPICISATREGECVAISVRDEGRGIAPDRLSQLFRKYTSGDPDDVGGGISLSICKGLVEAHGGRIRAESDGLGLGSCFTFTVPVVAEADSPKLDTTQKSLQDDSVGTSARILVVDDDPLALRFVRETLSEAGYTAIVTGDYRELPKLIETEKPDLVLLDLVFPDTDGIELLQHNSELASLPVIFVSGYGRDSTIAKALDSGAVDYIVKPFAPTELVARIRAALRGRGSSLPFELNGLTIQYDERRVNVDGDAVDLTATEFDLLRVLSRGEGRVMTYDALVNRVWRGDGDADLVRAFVKQLRRKLGDDSRNPRWIFNQRGVGYYMPHGKAA